MSCNTSAGLLIYYYIKIAMNIIFIVTPIILLIMSTIDLLGAVTGDKNAFQKAWANIFKRMIIAIIILILPVLINLTLSIVDMPSFGECLNKATKKNIERLEKEEEEKKKLSSQQLLEEQKTRLSALEKEAKKRAEEEAKRKEEEKEQQNNENKSSNEELLVTGEIKKTFTGSNGKTITYWVLIPENATENMPLVTYLHGGGGNGLYNAINDLEMAHEVKRVYGNNYPFIALIPVKTTSSWYEMGRGFKVFAELVNEVSNEYKINKDKVILTGCSDGGVGTWEFGVDYPELFSALVPVSGWGTDGYTYNRLERLKDMNIRSIISSANYDANFRMWTKKACDKFETFNSKGQCVINIIDGLDHGTIVTGATVNGKFIEGAYSKEVFEWMISQ